MAQNLNKLELIFNICILLAMLSVIFDISMTYTFYKKDVNYFLKAEGNKSLVGELKAGVPFFRTVTVSTIFFSPLMIFYIISWFKNSKNRYKFLKSHYKTIYKSLLIISICMLISGTITHFYGGFTWII